MRYSKDYHFQAVLLARKLKSGPLAAEILGISHITIWRWSEEIKSEVLKEENKTVVRPEILNVPGSKILGAYINVKDRRRPFDFNEYYSCLEKEDYFSAQRLAEDAAVGLQAFLRDIVSGTIMTVDDISAVLKWDKGYMYRTMKSQFRALGVPVYVVKTLAEITGKQCSEIMFASKMPIRMLPKHELLFSRLMNVDSSRIVSFAEKAEELFKQDETLKNTDDLYALAYRRLKEISSMRGKPLNYVTTFYCARRELAHIFRKMEQDQALGQRGRLFFQLCLASQLSPDYLLRQDYSDLVDSFHDLNGQEHTLSPEMRRLYKALMFAPDAYRENEFIGRVLGESLR